jgi:hypothetical protein
MPEFYPEETKAQKSKRYGRTQGKVVKAFPHQKCGRCGTEIEEGSECVWLRKHGVFHFQGKCPKKEEQKE